MCTRARARLCVCVCAFVLSASGHLTFEFVAHDHDWPPLSHGQVVQWLRDTLRAVRCQCASTCGGMIDVSAWASGGMVDGTANDGVQYVANWPTDQLKTDKLPNRHTAKLAIQPNWPHSQLAKLAN